MEVREALHARLPLFYVFLSGIGFSIQALIIKLSAEQGFQGSFQCVFLRGVVQLLLSSYFIYHNEDRRAGKGPKLFGDTYWVSFMLFMRSVAGFGSIAFGFLAVELIPIGDELVLVALSPLMASILSYFILGEPWRLPELCGTMLSLVGVVMVAKPPVLFGGSQHHDSTFYRGVTYALVSACCAALTFIIVRILGTTAKMPWANVVLSQAIGQIVLAFPGLYIFGQHLTLNISPYVASLLLFGGCVGAWSQVLMTIGMQREKSAAAAAVRKSDVAFGFLWQVLFTHDTLSLLSLGGAMLVTTGITVIVVYKESGPVVGSGRASVELSQVRSTIHDAKDRLLNTDEESEEATERSTEGSTSPVLSATVGRLSPAKLRGKKMFNHTALLTSQEACDVEQGHESEIEAFAHGEPDFPGHSSAGNQGGGYSALPQVVS